MKRKIIVPIILFACLTPAVISFLVEINMHNSRKIPIPFCDNIFYNESLKTYISKNEELGNHCEVQDLEESKSKLVMSEVTIKGNSAKTEAYFQKRGFVYYISSICFTIDANQDTKDELITCIISSLQDELSSYDGYYYVNDEEIYSIGINFGSTSLSYSIFSDKNEVKIESYWIF